MGQTGGQGRTDHVRAEKRQEQSPSRAEWPGDRAGGLGGVGGQGHPAVRSHSRPAPRHGAGHHVHMPAHVGMVGVDEEVLSAASGAQLRGPDPGRHPGTGQSRSAARAGHMPSFRTNPRWSPDDQLLREQLRRDPVVQWQAFYRRSTCVRARVCVCVRRCTCVHVCGCLHVHAYTCVMCALPYVHVCVRARVWRVYMCVCWCRVHVCVYTCVSVHVCVHLACACMCVHVINMI